MKFLFWLILLCPVAAQASTAVADEKKEEVILKKLTTVYLGGQEMFCDLGYSLFFNAKYGWHMRVKGGYIEVDILKGKL